MQKPRPQECEPADHVVSTARKHRERERERYGGSQLTLSFYIDQDSCIENGAIHKGWVLPLNVIKITPWQTHPETYLPSGSRSQTDDEG